MIRELGTFTIAVVNASATLALGQALELLSGKLQKVSELQTRLALLVSPPPMPSPADMTAKFAANLATYNPVQIVASLASLAATVQADVAAETVAVGALQNTVSTLQKNLSVGGITTLKFEGEAQKMGEEVAALMNGNVEGVKALILYTANDAAFAALATTLKAS